MSTTYLNIGGVTKEAPTNTPDKTFRDAWKWADPATNAVEIDWDLALIQFRDKAVMPKADFVNLAADVGLVSDADAVDAARGGWPSAFDTAIASLDAKGQREAKVTWAGVTEVRRDAPLLTAIVAAGLATEAALDALFGWVEPA